MLEEQDLKNIQSMIDTSIAASEERMGARFDAKLDEAIAASEERMGARFDAKLNEAIAASEERMSAKLNEAIAASENRMQAYFEGAIMPKFDLLMDAFQSVTETYAPLPRVERLEEDVTYLKSDVRELGREVKKLKKAQ